MASRFTAESLSWLRCPFGVQIEQELSQEMLPNGGRHPLVSWVEHREPPGLPDLHSMTTRYDESTMAMPAVTVLTAVYNGEQYLRDAIRSVLSQSFTDFEFLIVDDGSDDGTSEILRTYATLDSRIRVLRNHRNIGLTGSLNRGLSESKGEYIARLDADDVANADRLQKQVDYLDVHSAVTLLGTWAELVDEAGSVLSIWRVPESHDALRWLLCFNNVFAHSSVMFRRETAARLEGYSLDCKRSQDYEFWLRFARESRIACFPAPLVKIRRHGASITATDSASQVETHNRVARQYLRETYGIDDFSEEALLLLRNRRSGGLHVREEASRILSQLYRRHMTLADMTPEEIVIVREDTACRFWRICAGPGASVRLWLGFLQACQLNPKILREALLRKLRPIFVLKNRMLGRAGTVRANTSISGEPQ